MGEDFKIHVPSSWAIRYAVIAARFGISMGRVWRILSKESWRHVG